MKIAEIIDYLEQWAPPALQESYDNSGLITGDKNVELTGYLVTLDVTENVVAAAIAQKANMIIAHHPVVFSGLKKLTGRNWVQRTVIMAIKHEIAIYAIHTNLDNVHWGVNRKIGEALGLSNLKILAPKENQLLQLSVFAPESIAYRVKEAMCLAGAGQIGEYKDCAFLSQGEGQFRPTGSAQPSIGKLGELEKVNEVRIDVILPIWKQNQVLEAAKAHHSYEEIAYFLTPIKNTSDEYGSGMIGEWAQGRSLDQCLEKIKATFGGMIRYTANTNRPIRKIAFCGGSGSFLLSNALASGADLFLTADFKYHQFFDTEGQIVIADIGHFEIEQFTTQLIVDHLSKKFTTFAPLISTLNTNPVDYY